MKPLRVCSDERASASPGVNPRRAWRASAISRCNTRTSQGLVEALQPGGGGVADDLGDGDVHQTEAARRVQDPKHRQHHTQRDVEAGAVVMFGLLGSA